MHTCPHTPQTQNTTQQDTHGQGPAGRTASVEADRLDEYEGWVFWRFDLRFSLGPEERRVQYAFHAEGVDAERRCP